MTDPRPPIPVTCRHRPTVGGVVVPFGNVSLADGGVDFRAQHEIRVQECFVDGRCQVCGQRIPLPFVFLGGPRQLAAGQFDEPPLHPECAAYTSLACPMVAGRQPFYSHQPPVADGRRGQKCPVEGCGCDGWVPTPGLDTSPGGDPAHAWYAVYVSGYSLGVQQDRTSRVHVAVVAPEDIGAVRHISTPGEGRRWRSLSSGEVAAIRGEHSVT